MNLGLILSPGDSLTLQSQTGQLDRFVNYYLRPYIRAFNRVIIFSYGIKEPVLSLPHVTVISKPYWMSNYCYQFCLPFIHSHLIRPLDIIRVFQAPGGLPAVLAKIFFHKPYLVTYGYDYVYFARKNHQTLLALILSVVVPLVLKFSRKVIVTTPPNLTIPNSVLIPNGVDPDAFKPLGQRENYLILSVGRLEPQKRYDLLIKAVSQSQSKTKINLTIIGHGSQADYLTVLARELKVNLKLIGHLPHSQLIGWYQRASIFALTSAYEGHPKTLIEALSCGCPVLTTNFTGNPVTHKLNGLISRNQLELIKYLDQLLNRQKLCQQLGSKARELIINQYNIKQLIQQEIQLLLS